MNRSPVVDNLQEMSGAPGQCRALCRRQGGGNRAWRPSGRRPAGGDLIQLPPPEKLISSEGYEATALQELSHWSGDNCA